MAIDIRMANEGYGLVKGHVQPVDRNRHEQARIGETIRHSAVSVAGEIERWDRKFQEQEEIDCANLLVAAEEESNRVLYGTDGILHRKGADTLTATRDYQNHMKAWLADKREGLSVRSEVLRGFDVRMRKYLAGQTANVSAKSAMAYERFTVGERTTLFANKMRAMGERAVGELRLGGDKDVILRGMARGVREEVAKMSQFCQAHGMGEESAKKFVAENLEAAGVDFIQKMSDSGMYDLAEKAAKTGEQLGVTDPNKVAALLDYNEQAKTRAVREDAILKDALKKRVLGVKSKIGVPVFSADGTATYEMSVREGREEVEKLKDEGHMAEALDLTGFLNRWEDAQGAIETNRVKGVAQKEWDEHFAKVLVTDEDTVWQVGKQGEAPILMNKYQYLNLLLDIGKKNKWNSEDRTDELRRDFALPQAKRKISHMVEALDVLGLRTETGAGISDVITIMPSQSKSGEIKTAGMRVPLEFEVADQKGQSLVRRPYAMWGEEKPGRFETQEFTDKLIRFSQEYDRLGNPTLQDAKSLAEDIFKRDVAARAGERVAKKFLAGKPAVEDIVLWSDAQVSETRKLLEGERWKVKGER